MAFGSLRSAAQFIKPLKIDADIYADTRNFEVSNLSSPRSSAEAHDRREVCAGARSHPVCVPARSSICDTRTDFGQSRDQREARVHRLRRQRFVLSVLKGSRIDLADVSPIVGIPIAGKAEVDVEMTGVAPDIVLTGGLKVGEFQFGGFPFGDIASAKVRFKPLVLDLADVQVKKEARATTRCRARA